MSVLIKHMAMPKGCIYANDKDQTEYCPLLNHDDVPFCQYIENEPEIAIGIDERPVYCPLSDVPEPCQDAVSRAATIDALDEIESEVADGYGYQYEKWRKYFCELPSVQPKRTKKRTGTHACDSISRQAAIEVIDAVFPVDPMKSEYAQGIACGAALAKTYVEQLPSAQQEIKPIEYRDCANAMLRMWIDNVVTDGEYNRIMDKLNAHWGTKNE